MNKFNSFVASGIIASLLSSIGCASAFTFNVGRAVLTVAYGGIIPDYFRKPRRSSHKNDETTTVTVAKDAEDDSSDKSNENKESKGEK